MSKETDKNKISKPLYPTKPLHRMETRISSKTVYKLGPTVRDVRTDFLGLIQSVFSTSPLPLLQALWSGSRLIDIVRKLHKGYEHLEDPIEQSTFETLFKLQGELSSVYYETLKNKGFKEAWSHILPTTEEITQKLIPELSDNQVLSALKALEKREIIGQEKNQWYIRL